MNRKFAIEKIDKILAKNNIDPELKESLKARKEILIKDKEIKK